MRAEQAIAFLVFAFAASLTPGPNNVMLTATGANVGLLRGLPHLFGIAAGFAFMMFVVALGLGSLVIDTPWAMTTIRWAGVALLLWFAWRIATAGRGNANGTSRPIGFVGAAAFQWVNPKAWFITASAVATYLEAGTASATVQSLAFAGLFVLAILPCGALWLGFGAVLQRRLFGGRLRAFNMIMAAVLAASVLLFVF